MVHIIDDTAVPGTVHLVDLDGTMHVQHLNQGSHKDIVLVPRPTADPDDPLNWSRPRKYLSLFCTMTYVWMVGISSAAIYSVFGAISEATGLPLGDLNAGTGYMFLLFGWGCLFWQPIALTYGRRGVYLISFLGTIAMNVWAAHSTNNGTWIAHRLLIGFFGAPIESLCEISVADIFFAHERGTYMGMYMFFLANSNFFAPLIGGFISDGMGWQWVLYWCAIFNAIGFVICFFLMEETMYYRGKDVESDNTGSETPSLRTGDVTPTSADAYDEKKVGMAPTEYGVGQSQLYQGKTYIQKLKLVTVIKERPFELFKMMYRPLLLLQFPVIAWSGFQYGLNLCWFNVLNATASLIFSGEPYNFRASMVGLTYIAPMIGVTFASWYAGKLSDIVCLKLARRNKGIREPEHRLWMFLGGFLFTPVGLILWGVGASKAISWGGLVIGMGLVGFTITIGGGIPINYTVDSYKDLSGEAMITVILIRNTCSFGFNYGITPWITASGLQNTFIAIAMISIGVTATFLPMVKYGKSFRRRSAKKYWRYVESGVGH